MDGLDICTKSETGLIETFLASEPDAQQLNEGFYRRGSDKGSFVCIHSETLQTWTLGMV